MSAFKAMKSIVAAELDISTRVPFFNSFLEA